MPYALLNYRVPRPVASGGCDGRSCLRASRCGKESPTQTPRETAAREKFNDWTSRTEAGNRRIRTVSISARRPGDVSTVAGAHRRRHLTRAPLPRELPRVIGPLSGYELFKADDLGESGADDAARKTETRAKCVVARFSRLTDGLPSRARRARAQKAIAIKKRTNFFYYPEKINIKKKRRFELPTL